MELERNWRKGKVEKERKEGKELIEEKVRRRKKRD